MILVIKSTDKQGDRFLGRYIEDTPKGNVRVEVMGRYIVSGDPWTDKDVVAVAKSRILSRHEDECLMS